MIFTILAVFSRLAKRNHAKWGLRETPFAIRCLEDIQAVEGLGVVVYTFAEKRIERFTGSSS